MNKETILIVEDEKVIAFDLKRRLERVGFHIIEVVSTAKEAMEKCREFSPSIVLMDIMLSEETDGIEAAKEIKKLFQIPSIFLTAYADEKTIARAKEAQPLGYILKPFKDRELLTTIEMALFKHHMDKELTRQRLWFSAILHSVHDGIIATDPQGVIQFLNPTAEQITGWENQDALQVPLDEVLKIEESKTHESLILPPFPINHEEIIDLSIKDAIIEGKSGLKVPVEGSISMIKDHNGNNSGLVVAIHDVSRLKEMSETILYQASHDSLTGLINREGFSHQLSNLIEDVKTSELQHALLYLDLDQFTIINETCGHAAGDELLKLTTTIFKKELREDDTCARLGSDEFGILLENTSQETAFFIATRLQSRLSEYKFSWGENVYNIVVSIGLVMINFQSKDLFAVMAAADVACTMAKEEGGNKIKMYESSDSSLIKRKGELKWVSRLRHSLEKDRFRLYVQEIRPLKNSLKPKYEILIRLLEKNDQIIYPAQFIPAAERYHLMPAIDRWVVREALNLHKRLLQTDQAVTFTINISAPAVADDSFLDYVQKEMNQKGVNPQLICFEITETAALHNINTARNFMETLKKNGCSFALDDFGSGFSSFSHLKNLPVDFLKIDGSFVKDMAIDPNNYAMVESINKLGHVIGMLTIAEFVVDNDVLSAVQGLGVDYAQGYAIAKPVPCDELFKPPENGE